MYFLKLDGDGKLSAKFGVLFQDDKCTNLFEALVGTLKVKLKRRKRAMAGASGDEGLLTREHQNSFGRFLTSQCSRDFDSVDLDGAQGFP